MPLGPFAQDGDLGQDVGARLEVRSRLSPGVQATVSHPGPDHLVPVQKQLDRRKFRVDLDPMVLAEGRQPFHQLSQRGDVVAFVVQGGRDYGKPKMPLFGEEQDIFFPHRGVQRRLRPREILEEIPKGSGIHDGSAQGMGPDLLPLLHHQQELLTKRRTRAVPLHHLAIMPAYQP